MTPLLAALIFLAGIFLLYYGAEWLVHGAAALAISLGVTPLVVGLTVVSFATSAPEAAASLMALLVEGSGDMALGNVLGSNIANIGLILGATTIMMPIPVNSKTVMREIPIMLAVTVLLVVLLAQGSVGRLEGFFLLFTLGGYILFHVFQSRRGTDGVAAGFGPEPIRRDLAYIVAGTTILVLGGYLLVRGASDMMHWMGISDRVIGLTAIAFGTSCPELAASLVAAAKGETDIAIGNVVGSNIFNLLFIVGLTASVQPLTVDSTFLYFDIPILMGFSALLWFFALQGRRIGRPKGIILVSCYVIYAGFLLFLQR